MNSLDLMWNEFFYDIPGHCGLKIRCGCVCCWQWFRVGSRFNYDTLADGRVPHKYGELDL